jgi:hypothetical protein
MPETRSVTTNTISPTSLFPDTIPSTTPNRENIPAKFDRNLRFARRAGPSTVPTVISIITSLAELRSSDQ